MQNNPFNMACIYMAADSRLTWTENQIKPYIVHTYQKNGVTKKKWFFDSFLVLDTLIYTNGQHYALSLDQYRYADIQNHILKAQPADKVVWEALLDKYFGIPTLDGILKKINDAIALAKQELGEPNFKHRIVLGLPEPLAHYPNPNYNPQVPESKLHMPVLSSSPDGPGFVWGLNESDESIVFHRILNGNSIDAKVEYEGCSYAVNWFIDQCLNRWDNNELPHLKLAGFYWVNEGGPAWYNAFDTIMRVKEHIESINQLRSSNLILSFSPYYNYYNGVWTENGNSTPYRSQCNYFDIVFAQPNYSLGAGSVIPVSDDEIANQNIEASQYTRFVNAITKAVNLGDGINVEMDEECVYGRAPKGPKKQDRVYRYLEALNNRYHMDLLFYNGNGLIAYIEDSNTTFYYKNENGQNVAYQTTDEDRALIHQLAMFVHRRHRQITAYNNADVNEDGTVDVVDMQIVLNEMLGISTAYADRADVNRDGIVDIVDVNQISHVMLGHLSEMEDDE